MSTSSASKAGYHHGDLRGALLEAARSLVEASGPEGVSLREAARRAGVSHNAPYRHFESREALLAEVAREGFEAFAAALEAARAQASPNRARLEMGIAYVRFALDHPGLHRLMFSRAVDRAAHPALADAARAAFAVLEGDVAADLGAERAGPVALRAWATVHGLAQLLIDGELEGTGERWRSPEALVEAVLTAGA